MDHINAVDVFPGLAVLPWLSVLPAIYFLRENSDGEFRSIAVQLKEMWGTVCSQAVWQPMAFTYIFSVLQVGNAAWTQYMYTVLRFTAQEINSLLVVAYVLLYVGVVVYKKFFITWNFRYVYWFCSGLNVFFSFLQVLLILRWNYPIPDYVFALGDEALAEFVYGIQYLPTIIMMVSKCNAKPT